ncbi:MAG: hypothetical protein EON85_07030 [Brevundimonas sp.]|nr:MAG: hypothetical protein EON85_07030 [Brevundimonas sp.]
MEPVFIVFIIFAAIVAVVVGPFYLKSRERRSIQETVRHAIDQGQPLPTDMIEALSKDITRRLPSRSRDIRSGVILLALGLGVSLVFFFLGMQVERDLYGFAAFGFIPALLGLAFIALSVINKNKD